MDGVSTPVEARHRALLEAIPDLLLRLRADGTYLEVAGDLSRLANPPERVIGARVHNLLEPEIAEQLMAGVAEALETGALATVNYKLRTWAGVECDFELRIAPAGPDEVDVIARDVTDVREAIRELRESRARVVAAGDAARRRIERNLHDGAQQRARWPVRDLERRGRRHGAPRRDAHSVAPSFTRSARRSLVRAASFSPRSAENH